MKKRTAWIVSMLVAGAAAFAPDASAQMPGGPSPYGSGPGMPPAAYGPQMGPGMANPYAPPSYAVPAGYMSPPPADPAAMPMGAPEGYGYGEGMYEGEGCDTCGPGGLFAGKCNPGILRCLLPYDDGGCCAPHWFDVHVEYMRLRREDVSRTVDFISDSPLGPIVLSTDNLDFEPEDGFRATVTRQVGPGSNLELSYFGQHQWSSAASVTSANNGLFSVFSDFGTFPLAGQGFTETDQAAFASIAYSSTIDNLELNFRQRWQGYGCKVQGSWIAGARFFQLDEDFLFITQAPINSAEMNYRVTTHNGLIGAQGGGDVWICLIPGLSVGVDAKLGLYQNYAHQSTTLAATTVIPTLQERVEDDDFAFVGEASLLATWRLSQSWTLRGSYNFIFVDGVALGPENFNPNPPFLVPAFTNPPREPTINHNGDIFLHGFTAGFEYMW